MSKLNVPIVDDAQDLELLGIVGFDGRTTHGLRVHPNGTHVVYPLGCKVAIVEWETKKQEFLEGHTNLITTIDISRCGKYVGSGQINHMGFKALVILWDFKKRVALLKHDVHKVRVESLAFSKDSVFLYSLGGRDDENVVATHIPTLEPMCGYPAPNARAGNALTVVACNRRDLSFITAGENTLRIWHVDPIRRNVRPTDVGFNKLKRDIFCVALDWRDEWAYCGTLTGDILKAKLNFPEDDRLHELERPPLVSLALGKIPKKSNHISETDNYSKGVRDILVVDDPFGRQLIVGAGDGTVEMVVETEVPPPTKTKSKTQKLKVPSQPRLTPIQSTFVDSAVTTLQFFNRNPKTSCGLSGSSILVGTELCEIYLIDIASFNTKLIITCHTTTIYDLCFPKGSSEVFVTAGKDDIRVWNTASCKELLRIAVPNFTCTAVKFMDDGSAIVSGWNDGCIRAFTPRTGQLQWTIHNGHNKGVSALDVTSCGRRIVSGGGEGQVRVWELYPTHQDLGAIMKDHKGPVSAIHINCDNTQAVSASTDGSCIIWDLVRKVRWQILFANSLFMACKYNPEGCQVLTAGTDRKVQYWEVLDGSLIREFEASVSAAINSLDISADGRHFVTGSNDCLVKVWNYDEGFTTHIGVGHAGIITAVKFSPDFKYIISVSDDGAIFIWSCPFEEEERAPRPASVGSRSTCSLRSMAFRMAGEGFDLPSGAPAMLPGSAGGDSCALAVTRRRSSDESSRGSTPGSRTSQPVCVPKGSAVSRGSQGSRGSHGPREPCHSPGQIARESRGCNVTEVDCKDKTPSRTGSSFRMGMKTSLDRRNGTAQPSRSTSSIQKLGSKQSSDSVNRQQSADSNRNVSRQGSSAQKVTGNLRNRSIKEEPTVPSREIGEEKNQGGGGGGYAESDSDSDLDVTN